MEFVMRNYLIILFSLLTVSFVNADDCQKETPSKLICKILSEDVKTKGFLNEKQYQEKSLRLQKLEIIIDSNKFEPSQLTSTFLFRIEAQKIKNELQKHKEAKAYLQSKGQLEVFQSCLKSVSN